VATQACVTKESKGLSVFERYLTARVVLCILAGIGLGRVAPGVARYLDGLAVTVNGAPVISTPIAVCLFFMMCPIMIKIDFADVLKAGKTAKPVGLTLFVNWAIKPFTMYATAMVFLGVLFRRFIGTEAVDYVRRPISCSRSGFSSRFHSLVRSDMMERSPRSLHQAGRRQHSTEVRSGTSSGRTCPEMVRRARGRDTDERNPT